MEKVFHCLALVNLNRAGKTKYEPMLCDVFEDLFTRRASGGKNNG